MCHLVDSIFKRKGLRSGSEESNVEGREKVRLRTPSTLVECLEHRGEDSLYRFLFCDSFLLLPSEFIEKDDRSVTKFPLTNRVSKGNA